MGPGPGQRGTPHLLESRVRGGSPPTHVPPGSCCCACWSGESRCVPGTPASAPLQPPSCGDREGATEDMTARAVGPWELHFGPRNSFSERRIQAVKEKPRPRTRRTWASESANLSLRAPGLWLIQRPQDHPPKLGLGALPPPPPPPHPPTPHPQAQMEGFAQAGQAGHRSFFTPAAQHGSESHPGWPAPLVPGLGFLIWGTSAHPASHPECVPCPILAMGFE